MTLRARRDMEQLPALTEQSSLPLGHQLHYLLSLGQGSGHRGMDGQCTEAQNLGGEVCPSWPALTQPLS